MIFNDKYARKHGWFEFTKKPACIYNFKSDQKLAVIDMKKSRQGELLYCEYTDPEITQEIQIHFPTKEKSKVQFVEVDYRSTFKEPPSYWIWRRIDDFLSDALLCWPPLYFEFKYHRIRIFGGFVNSEYVPSFEREFHGRGLSPSISMANYIVATPEIPSQHITPPLKWHYRDVNIEKLDIYLKLNHIPDSSAKYLSLLDNLEEIKSSAPYLEREDKKSYILPTKIIQSIRGREAIPVIYLKYLFINEHMFFENTSGEYDGFSVLQNHASGYLNTQPNKKYWSVSAVGKEVALGAKEGIYKSYAAWRECLNDLTNAWAAWKESNQRIPIDKSSIDKEFWNLNLRPGIFGDTLWGGYQAGMTNSRYKVKNKYGT